MTTSNSDSENQSTKFLRVLGPRRPLASINPETGAIAVRTFEKPDDASKWIDERNGKVNLYYTINPTKKPMNRKPTEADISEFQFAHVEADPLPGEDAADARKRHRAAFKCGIVPTPTIIYNSGNGVVALWKLEEPIPLTDKARIADCKAINKALALALGGKEKGYDTCYSVEHLLRLAYTKISPTRRSARRAAKSKTRATSNSFRTSIANMTFRPLKPRQLCPKTAQLARRSAWTIWTN